MARRKRNSNRQRDQLTVRDREPNILRARDRYLESMVKEFEPFLEPVRTPPSPTWRQQIARSVRQDRVRTPEVRRMRVIDTRDLDEVSLAFTEAIRHDRRASLRPPMTPRKRCIEKCKGTSRRKKGRWRGGMGAGMAVFIKNKICQVRCR